MKFTVRFVTVLKSALAEAQGAVRKSTGSSRSWRFRCLRHAHTVTPIAAGPDAMTKSRHLGQIPPARTLSIRTQILKYKDYGYGSRTILDDGRRISRFGPAVLKTTLTP